MHTSTWNFRIALKNGQKKITILGTLGRNWNFQVERSNQKHFLLWKDCSWDRTVPGQSRQALIHGISVGQNLWQLSRLSRNGQKSQCNLYVIYIIRKQIALKVKHELGADHHRLTMVQFISYVGAKNSFTIFFSISFRFSSKF